MLAEQSRENPRGCTRNRGAIGIPFGKLRAGFRLRECCALRSTHFAQDDKLRGLAWPTILPIRLRELDAPSVAVSRVGRDADGSRDFADVKLVLRSY
jgi:hypothetical protein